MPKSSINNKESARPVAVPEIIDAKNNEVAPLEREIERLRDREENLRDAWPVINGILVVPPDGILEKPDIAGHILDVLFEALGDREDTSVVANDSPE